MKKEVFLKLMDGIDDRLVEKYAISDEAEARQKQIRRETTAMAQPSNRVCSCSDNSWRDWCYNAVRFLWRCKNGQTKPKNSSIYW